MRHVLIAALGALSLAGADASARPFALTAFGGVSLNNTWEEVFIDTPNLRFQDAGVVGVAASTRVWTPTPGLDVELEAQLVRTVGAQTHWEINAPVAVARWTAFPWDATVDTSAAFGLGLSFSSETPALEVEQEGDSQPTMVYWMIELEAGPPDSDWSFIGRVHHRSSAYGLFGDDGGLNSLVAGVRRQF